MTTMILRAKRIDLLQTRPLTKKQQENRQLNMAELADGKGYLSSYPRRIVLEITNACNLKCVMCGRNAIDFTATHFDLNHFEKIEEALNFAEEVTLFGWGEPTIHPHFVEILEHLDQFPVRKYFVTNGTQLDRIKNAIFKYKVDIIAISLDGACASTNNRIRRGSDFDKVINSISSIVMERNERGVSYPYMNFVFTAMNSNYREIPDMVKLAHQIGIEEVKYVYITVFSEDLIPEVLWDKQNLIKNVFDDAVKLAHELQVKIKLPHLQGQDEAGDRLHKDCFVGWRDFFLGSDGYVRSCQSTSRKLFHVDKYKSFMEMWNAAPMQDFRQRVNDEKTMPYECSQCYQSSHCNWNRKEAFIQLGQRFAPEWEKKHAS